MGGRRRLLAPALVAGVIAVLSVVTIVLWTRLPHDADDVVASYGVAGLMWTLVLGGVGVLVLRDSPGNLLGPLFAGIGIWFGVNGIAGALQPMLAAGSAAYAWLALVNGLWIVVVPAAFLIPHLYPDGHPMSARWRVPALVGAACIPVSLVCGAVYPGITEPESGVGSAVNPLGVPALSAPVSVLMLVSVLGSLLLGVVVLVAQALRARRLVGDARARVGWLIAFFVLMVVAVATTGWLNLAIQVAAALSLGIGVVRHHLFDIQRVLSRSLTYALVVGAVLAAALVTAAVLGSYSDVGLVPALVAAVVAVVLASGLSRLRRRVDRWVYGAGRDPAEALTVLGDRLATATDAEDVLPQVVSTVRESLGLPYAAITLAGEPGRAVESGDRGTATVSYPLRYGGEDVGLLELGPRSGDTDLSPRDARLVATLSTQAGAAAHSAKALRELRRSREQLVAAREEERRSLRRDLHDGLGPTLAGMALGLQSLERRTVDGDQAQLASELLAQARGGLDEVRRLSRDLRPAALDELGLAEALRQHAQTVRRMSGGSLDVQVALEGDLPELPAAVEVAAYRISQEAVSNATRHAGATTCVVGISVDGALVIAVRDDGCGSAPSAPGTGLRSMRERADELGGSCTVTFIPGSGTEVQARLPLTITASRGTR
jgi:two-component system, NarL family, sensor kinase